MQRQQMEETALRFLEWRGRATRSYHTGDVVILYNPRRLGQIARATNEPAEKVKAALLAILHIEHKKAPAGFGRRELGKIALKYVKYRMSISGVGINPNTRRELANVAKAIGVPRGEVFACTRALINELAEEHFR